MTLVMPQGRGHHLSSACGGSTASDGEILAQVAQGGDGCTWKLSWVGWGSEQPDLVEDVLDHFRGVGTR